MRKQIFGRRLKRDVNQRKALFRSLMRELVIHERIQTTEAKAKSIKSEIEKHVTKAKNLGDNARVHLQKHFQHDVVEKIVADIAPRFKERPGGYTRIIRLGNRTKDNASMVFIEWVEKGEPMVVAKPAKRKAAKKADQNNAAAPAKEAKEAAKTEKKETKTQKKSAKKVEEK